MRAKDANGIANNIGTEQSALFAQTAQSESECLWYSFLFKYLR